MSRRAPTESPIPLLRQAERTTDLLEQLKEAGGKRTLLRAHVLGVFAETSPRHVTAGEIHKALERIGAPGDISGVYRALTAFLDCGLVCAVSSGSTMVYGLADPPHHHTTCTRCGAVGSLPSGMIRRATMAITDTAERHLGFHPARSPIVVQGICDTCRTAPNAAAAGEESDRPSDTLGSNRAPAPALQRQPGNRTRAT